MQEDKSRLLNYAMNGGLLLGLFWVIKYLLVIGSETMPALHHVASMLTLGTPLILFWLLTKYKNDVTEGRLSFGHGVQFAIMLFFFASILEAALVFVHVTWMDTAFIGKQYAGMIETVRSSKLSDKMVQTLENQPLPSIINYLISNVILANVFSGIVLSIILVPLSNRTNFLNFRSKPHNKNG